MTTRGWDSKGAIEEDELIDVVFLRASKRSELTVYLFTFTKSCQLDILIEKKSVHL